MIKQEVLFKETVGKLDLDKKYLKITYKDQLPKS